MCHSVHRGGCLVWGVICGGLGCGLGGVGVWSEGGGLTPPPPPPQKWLLPRSVRILLECILVWTKIISKNEFLAQMYVYVHIVLSNEIFNYITGLAHSIVTNSKQPELVLFSYGYIKQNRFVRLN